MIYKGLYIYNDARARVDRGQEYQHQSYDRPTGWETHVQYDGTEGSQKSTPALKNSASEDCHVICDDDNHDKVLVACATRVM